MTSMSSSSDPLRDLKLIQFKYAVIHGGKNLRNFLFTMDVHLFRNKTIQGIITKFKTGALVQTCHNIKTMMLRDPTLLIPVEKFESNLIYAWKYLVDYVKYIRTNDDTIESIDLHRQDSLLKGVLNKLRLGATKVISEEGLKGDEEIKVWVNAEMQFCCHFKTIYGREKPLPKISLCPRLRPTVYALFSKNLSKENRDSYWKSANKNYLYKKH